MSERALQLQLHKLLRARPELVWHHCGRPHLCQGQAGLPDLVIAGPRRLIWREVKGDDTPVRLEQREYGEALMSAGQSWGVWRPDDLLYGQVESELDRL